MGILFSHFPKYCCGQSTCEKRVSVSVGDFHFLSTCSSRKLKFGFSAVSSSQTLFFLQFTFLKKFLKRHAPCIAKLTANRMFSQAPSTRIRIFLNPQLFLSGYGYRPHVSGEFDSESGKK